MKRTCLPGAVHAALRFGQLVFLQSHHFSTNAASWLIGSSRSRLPASAGGSIALSPYVQLARSGA